MAGLGVGLVALFVVTAVGTVLTGRAPSVGFSLGQSLYFSVTLVAGAAVFLAVGALTSQLANTRRRAASMAAVIFGVAYALRMVADSDPSAALDGVAQPARLDRGVPAAHRPPPDGPAPGARSWWSRSRAVTVHLAGTRDLGAATLADRDTAPPHLALLGSPVGLAIRLMRPVALGWLFAVAAMSVLIGTVAESATKDRYRQQQLSRRRSPASADTAPSSPPTSGSRSSYWPC